MESPETSSRYHLELSTVHRNRFVPGPRNWMAILLLCEGDTRVRSAVAWGTSALGVAAGVHRKMRTRLYRDDPQIAEELYG